MEQDPVEKDREQAAEWGGAGKETRMIILPREPGAREQGMATGPEPAEAGE